MPLPILVEREWGEGYYGGWFYGGHRADTNPPPKPVKGGAVKPLGERRPGPTVTKK